MSANSLLITRSNIHELTPDNILSFNSKKHWHKFILEDGGLYDKETVLQAVLDSITPFDLVPVKYTVEGQNAYFLARNCGQAIEKFCLNLFAPIKLKDSSGEIRLSIQTCSVSVDQYKMNMQFHLKKAIEKRYDENRKGFINLSSFHKEQELYEVLFCPLSKPRNLVYVLRILKRILNINAIDLSNNDIEVLKPLEVLHEFEDLICVDLSNNKISDPDLSEVLQKAVPHLQELNLRGNPICSTFQTELEYLKWIRDKNQHIRKLDGLLINYGFPNHQVYLCSDKVQGIVNQFLKHYFTLYDEDRQTLEQTYEKNAIFSLTIDHGSSQSFVESKMECYKNESTNLLKIPNVNEIHCITHRKNKNIVGILKKLPLTEHDPYSFKIDVLFYTEPFILISVTGIFKDFQDAPRVRSFSRTFTIKRVNANEFKITNDLFHVTNATEDEKHGSFMHSKQSNQSETKMIVSKEEEENLIQVLSKLTEMNSAYSRRCLEDCNWDVKKALEVFLENYEVFNIPMEAFGPT